MAIRVYELSKKLGISNKELLELLEKHGYTLTSIATIPAEALALIEKGFAQKKTLKEKVPSKEKEKPVTAPQKVQEQQAPLVAAAPSRPVQPQRRQPVTTSRQKNKGRQSQLRPPQKAVQPPIQAEVEPTEIILASMTIAELARKIRRPASDVILTLLKRGIAATINQLLSEKEVAELAEHYGLTVIEKTPVKPQEEKIIVHEEGVWQSRLPVVVVIGHVDHGKTTLLDFIRKTRVAAKEKGGITQHLGAYEVNTAQGNIVFLDTPGHEAFSLMRARGIKVADIAVLIVAVDDGVMPQTVEAIKRAKLAEIPIIVALNKVDKASPAQIEAAKQQLTRYDLTPEEWGGTTVCLPISAKLGQGIDELLDVIVLQSQLMELKANISVPAQGFVLESTLERGRGPVATVICQHGVLKIGDYFISGAATGRVSSLVDSYGNRVKEIYPSLPVVVAGFSQLPHVGDMFEVTTQRAVKKAVPAQVRVPDILRQKRDGEATLNFIVKADNASSREAVSNALSRLKSDHKAIAVLYAGVGDITESDILLAADTGSMIYGFQVKVQPHAYALIRKKGVLVKNFDIIYKLTEDVEKLIEASKPIEMVSKKIGEAVVLKVFDIKNLGIIAGSLVKTGRCVRNGKVLVWRGKEKVGEGAIKGLQRERKSVKEVHAGFECGFLVDGFDGWEVDDRVECYQEVPAS